MSKMRVEAPVATILTVAALFMSCVSSPLVECRHLESLPRVIIEWPEMALWAPAPILDSGRWIDTQVTVDGTDVLISGRYSLMEQPRWSHFDLQDLGLPDDNRSRIRFFWVDGSGRTPLVPVFVTACDIIDVDSP